jgi:hypothetical protein
MAHFRAVINGTRGEASRLGSKSSGIRTKLQTWGYDVIVDAKCCDNETGKPETTDWATIVIARHDETSGKLIASVNLTTGQIVYHKVAV